MTAPGVRMYHKRFVLCNGKFMAAEKTLYVKMKAAPDYYAKSSDPGSRIHSKKKL